MTRSRTTEPSAGEQPTWSEHWDHEGYEWELAARDVCELSDRTRAVAETYLVWKAGTTQPDGEPWWHTHLDWSRLAKDLDDRRVGLSSTEKALARVAIGLNKGSGEIEYQALFSAGLLTEVLTIIQRWGDAIDAASTRG